MGASLHAVGERLTEHSNSDMTATRVSSYAKILVGALVLGAGSLVPVLGELVWCAAALAGSGSILATRARPATRP
jgi:hypothetical protein